MAVMNAAPSAFNNTDTLSPTATGLVLRMPLSLKLPFILQLCVVPSSASTTYQLPVFLITNPFIYVHEFFIGKVTQICAHHAINACFRNKIIHYLFIFRAPQTPFLRRFRRSFFTQPPENLHIPQKYITFAPELRIIQRIV